MAMLMLTAEEEILLLCCVCRNLANDPVLLPCFCSCCRGCAEAIRSGESSECPLCKEKFKTCLLQESTYVSAQITILRARNGLSNCDLCEDRGVVVAAQYRCHECQFFLCEQCSDEHRKHMRQHDQEDLNSYLSSTNVVSAPPKALCKVHKQVLGIVCQQCKCLKCTTCLETCVTSKHDLVGLKQHLANVVKDIESATTALTESSLSVDRLEHVMREFDTSRKEHTTHLEGNKIKLLNAVTTSFVESKSAVEDIFGGTVQEETQKAIDIVLLLKGKIERFSMYCKSVAESGDVGSLVNQHQQILARLTSLLYDKLNAPTSIVVNKIVIDNDHLENIQHIICKCIGIPKLVEVYEKEQLEQQKRHLKEMSEQEEQENAHVVLKQQLENSMQKVKDTQHQLQDEQQKSQGLRQQLEVLLEQSQMTTDELELLKSANLKLTQQLADIETRVKENQRQQQEEQQITTGLRREKCVLEENQLKMAQEHEQLKNAASKSTRNLTKCKRKLKDSNSQLLKEQQKAANLQRDKDVLLEQSQKTADELELLKSTNLKLTQQLADIETRVKENQRQQQEEQQITIGLRREKCVLEENQLKMAQEREQLEIADSELTHNLAKCNQKLKDSNSQPLKEQQKAANLLRDENVFLEQYQKTTDVLKQKLTQQLADSEKRVKDNQRQLQAEQPVAVGLTQALLGQHKKTTEEVERPRQQFSEMVKDMDRRLQEAQQMITKRRQDKCVTLKLSHVIGAIPDVIFRDVAVASAGAVFVATDHGLREYDSRGQEVSRPVTEGDTLSIDVFSDSRVAAGLGDCSVAVLSHDEAQSSREWRVTATFKTEVTPGCLAVAQDDSCLCVARGRNLDRVLYVYSCSGRLLLKKDLGYSIYSLASGTAAVVVSSRYEREQPLDGFSVEAYNYSGQLLWQRTSSKIVCDLCPDPRSIRVYMTVHDKNGVRVLRAEGQQETQEDIVSSSEALQQPWRMSMDRQATYLAVISGFSRTRTVTVFTVARS